MKKSKLKAEIKILKLRQENLIYEIAWIKSGIARIEDVICRNSYGDAVIPFSNNHKEIKNDVAEIKKYCDDIVDYITAGRDVSSFDKH